MTGETPFDKQRFRSAALDELLRIIREEEPPRPSTRLSSSQTLPSIAANRKTEAHKLSGLIRGELDWIVMQALDKDRSRRYETATGLAKDVQRYLSGDVVEACPPTLGYRLKKLYRRRRGTVLTGAAFAVVLLIATGLSTWQAMRAVQAERVAQFEREHAEEQSANARAALEFFHSGVKNAGPIYNIDPNMSLQTWIDGLAANLDHDDATAPPPLIEASLRHTLGSLYDQLQRSTDARRHLERALAIREKELGEDDRDTIDTTLLLGKPALWWEERQRDHEPGSIKGEQLVKKAVERAKKMLGPANELTLFGMTIIGRWHMREGRLEQAAQTFLNVEKSLGYSDDRAAMWIQYFLTWTYVNMKEDERAESHAAKALELNRKLFHSSDTYPAYLVMQMQAEILGRRNEVKQAEQLYRKVITGCERYLSPTVGVCLDSRSALAWLLHRQDRDTEALAVLEPAVKSTENTNGSLELQIDRAKTLHFYGWLLIQLDRYKEAQKPLEECLQLQQLVGDAAWPRSTLGMCLTKQEAYAEAESQLLRAYDDLLVRDDQSALSTQGLLRNTVKRLVDLYERWDKKDEAAKWEEELQNLEMNSEPETEVADNPAPRAS